MRRFHSYLLMTLFLGQPVLATLAPAHHEFQLHVAADSLPFYNTITHLDPGQLLGRFSSNSWLLIWYEGMLVSSRSGATGLDTLYVSYSDTTFSREDPSEPDTLMNLFSMTYATVSVVGNCVSYQESFNGDGGAHPICGISYHTLELGDKQEGARLADLRVNLADIFPEREILRALMADTLLQRYRLPDLRPRDLADFINNLGGGCEVELAHLLTSWSVYDCTSDSTIIEFGLTHGCEVMRGNFTTIRIILPIPPEQKEAFEQARQSGTLGKNMLEGHL
jgi:hypothetical protein